ncbi:MAG: DUF1641 domain-containing protein [Ignavibacteriae bacterium]|nr:DUF1641 domain-containing protein [Ignavibacteriota bacterium]
MTDTDVNNRIDALNDKLDFIVQELEYQRRHRLEMEDLKDDLMIVAKDVFQTSLKEFEELSNHLQTGDILHLLKKLVRNTNNLSNAFEQIESARDFLDDAKVISKEIFQSLLLKFDEMDRAGYFQFSKEAFNVMDKIVTSFSPQDVKNLGDNIVMILNTIKNLTQPEMLTTVNNAVDIYKNMNMEKAGNISLFGLLRELNKPEMKQGLLFVTKLVKGMAENKN